MVWKYFKQSDDKKLAKCLQCSKEYKTSGNTSNLRDHLKRMHPASDRDNTPSTSSSNRSSYNSIDSYFKRAVEYDSSSKRKKDIDTALAQLVTESFHPFNIVNDNAFRKFVKVLDTKIH
ncbi:PREDICTED: zinc finger BED domain-containing protein 1-like [Rhagoletis zephyria]|uniref:zinc finger BED domain-containing protein 1-like n=1 Tax=Rhagoletis zephyria TaxID=28612 RepID=UPI0008112E58|nr:PREDICTED: zinc finger BED domain-containing protein 1-like [Rhagoletis zephyria]